MPYIITTAPNGVGSGSPASPRRAVATLEEARELVPETDPPLDSRGAIYNMGSGEMIEVTRVEWRDIAAALAEHWPQADRPRVFGRLLDALNAAF